MDISPDKILFFDIETAPSVANYSMLNEEMQQLWSEKYARLQQYSPDKYPSTAAEGWSEAGIYAEYGRIVCISVGVCYTSPQDQSRHLRTKSFCGTDEKAVIGDFLALLGRFMLTPYHNLCGHNIKEFDIPFVCRRAVINGLALPDCLQIAGKKPWEVHFIDTMDLWKFGDYKNFTSLKTLTALFGIPTPKDDIDGSQVAEVYYKEHDLQRISVYCQKDVVATAQVYLRLTNQPLIAPHHIESMN